jgi:Uma2 family endonuclease
MSAIPKMFVSSQEYLAQERKAEFKSEYYRGEVFAMSGASYQHNRIKENLARKSGNQLGDGPCQVLTSDMRVKSLTTGLYTYPDILIVCNEPVFEDAHNDTLLNPRVIIEVLSESTEKYDRRLKFRHYRGIPTVVEYVLVAQDDHVIERYVRQPDENWLLTEFSDLETVFEFASVAVKIPMAEIYRGITFPDDATK